LQTLVTGAAGFIGAKLCNALRARGGSLRALVLPGEDRSVIDEAADEIVAGDITRPATLHDIADGIDIVFHLAARVRDYGGRRQFFDTILEGTRHLLAASAGRATRFVFVSSIAALGLGRHLKGLNEDAPIKTCGVPYADAKAAAEAVVRAYSQHFTRGCVIVRPANVIGPRSAWVQEVVRRMRSRGLPLIDGGRHSASLVYVDNLVAALLGAADREEAAGRTYHIRDDWQVTWARYLGDLGDMIGEAPRGSLPFPLAWYLGGVLERICQPLGLRPPVTRLAVAVMGRDGDVDTARARRELGWQTGVDYETAMARIREALTQSKRM
jgi:nucleoside-diphosphate-sugar epimerase